MYRAKEAKAECIGLAMTTLKPIAVLRDHSRDCFWQKDLRFIVTEPVTRDHILVANGLSSKPLAM